METETNRRITSISQRVYEYASVRDFYHMEGSVEEVRREILADPYAVIEYLLELLDETEE